MLCDLTAAKMGDAEVSLRPQTGGMVMLRPGGPAGVNPFANLAKGAGFALRGKTVRARGASGGVSRHQERYM